MVKLGRGSGLPQEARACRRVLGDVSIDDLEGDGAIQNGVVRPVGRTHRSVTQFDRKSVCRCCYFEVAVMPGERRIRKTPCWQIIKRSTLWK
jgi:hypothetical protein